jgi:hypothetical protein
VGVFLIVIAKSRVYPVNGSGSGTNPDVWRGTEKVTGWEGAGAGLIDVVPSRPF